MSFATTVIRLVLVILLLVGAWNVFTEIPDKALSVIQKSQQRFGSRAVGTNRASKSDAQRHIVTAQGVTFASDAWTTTVIPLLNQHLSALGTADACNTVPASPRPLKAHA